MPASRTAKTSFAAGELAPELLGRADLRAYANGANRLRNVIIQPTGGVCRRPGLRHVAMLPGPARLIAFEFNTEQTYLIVLTPGRFAVFKDDVEVAALAAPWAAPHLPQLAFTQSADTLLIAHPDVPVYRATRSSHTAWSLAPLGYTYPAYHRFAPEGVTLTASAASGQVTINASAAVFQAAHAGGGLRIGRIGLTIDAVPSTSVVIATVHGALTTTGPTDQWDELAFSAARGFPATLCFHQDRLVIGGSRDLPNRLFLSRSGEIFNFDTGTGLDDEAIAFGLVSDQVNAIRAVFSGRHLQVFTSGAEWMVSGDPLTPANIQLNRQTRVGSPVDRHVPPVDVDGATIFAARSGRGVHEFVYTDVQQAYQANDLALVARHLIDRPQSMAYDQVRRLLHVAMADGAVATLTLYRAEQVTAWTRQETDGAVRSLAEIDGAVYAAVDRAGQTRLERFDPAVSSDAALTGSAAVAQDEWSGLGHVEGREVTVLADGAPRGPAMVSGGKVTVDPPARAVEVGLAFAHVIEPLPPELTGATGTRSAPLRLVSVTFRLLETAALSADTGRGVLPVPFRRLDQPVLDAAPARFSGDVTIRALGWRRDALRPLWRIAGDSPLPMTLLSVTTDMRSAD